METVRKANVNRNLVFDPPSKIKLLAQYLKSHSPGRQTRLVLFLGAGAPRAAGLPLADELKSKVIEAIFKGSPIPAGVQEQTATRELEALMGTLQASFGNDGYEIVGRIIREFKKLPPSYHIIRELITDGYVEAVVTTNFDVLFDIMADYAGVKLHFMIDDSSFAGNVPCGATLIAKLHGCASIPVSMRGSWSDVTQVLPCRRQEVLTDLMASHVTVFVGYAGHDPDVIPVLEVIGKQTSNKPIWWVDPKSQPTEEIGSVLETFGSFQNYLPIDSEQFFIDLARELAPEPYPEGPEMTRAREHIREIRDKGGAKDFLTERERRIARTSEAHDFEERLNKTCDEFLASFVVEPRSVLHQKAWKTPMISEIYAGEFSSVVKLLEGGHGKLILS